MNNYVEQPLGYWEEQSYMMALLNGFDNDLFAKIVDRVDAIEGVKVTAVRDLTDKVAGGIRLTYNGEDYEVGYYPTEFSLPESYKRGPFFLSEQEMNMVDSAKSALTVYMSFNKKPKECFKFQLKLIMAMAPNLVAVVDESAEKLLPLKWVKMAINSSTTPSANDLYTIQAIAGDNDEIWIHTHGLCRCGTTELEVLQTNRENYSTHYNLITTFASYLLDNVDVKDIHGKGFHIGYFSNNYPIVATCLSWTKALNEYNNLSLGNIEDRRDGHNSKTSPIFVYQTENDERSMKVSTISVYNNLWEDNPLFFISNDETRIRTVIAKERFNYVKQLSADKNNDIVIKIALPVEGGKNYEHIYFRLVEFVGDKFRATLLQEPYADLGIHPGYVGTYSVEDVSDWAIYAPNTTITPTTAYILEK